MDQSLRELERRARLDDAERFRYEHARLRAGIAPGDTTGILRELAELTKSLHEVRAAHCSAMHGAFVAAVREGFEAGSPSVVRARCRLDSHYGPLSVSVQVDASGHDLLEECLLACAPLFASSWGRQSVLLLKRGLRHVHVGLDDLWSGPDLVGGREQTLSLREVTDVQETGRDIGLWIPPGVILEPADAVAAFVALDDARLALDAAWTDYVDRAESAWYRFAQAFLAERNLDAFAVHGFTPGYDDSQYCEHQQSVVFKLGDLYSGAVPEVTRRALEAALPAGETDWASVSCRQFGAFEEALRRRHGWQWVLLVRRTPEGPEQTVLPGWRPD